MTTEETAPAVRILTDEEIAKIEREVLHTCGFGGPGVHGGAVEIFASLRVARASIERLKRIEEAASHAYRILGEVEGPGEDAWRALWIALKVPKVQPPVSDEENEWIASLLDPNHD